MTSQEDAAGMPHLVARCLFLILLQEAHHLRNSTADSLMQKFDGFSLVELPRRWPKWNS